MSAYGIVTLSITDDGWVREYVRNVRAIVESHGGRYLARGGDFTQVEGEVRPDVVVLLEFPDMESLTAWYESDEYRPYRDARRGGSTAGFYLVPGL